MPVNCCESKSVAAFASVVVIVLALLIGQCAWLNCADPQRMCIYYKRDSAGMVNCLNALKGDSDAR